jgi:hypothetical protein
MDRQTWQFINSFADWFSAIGTVAAVIASLYFARHQNRAKLRVQTAIVTMVTRGQTPGEGDRFLRIQVANVGPRKAVVSSIGWQIGTFKKAHYIQVFGGNPYSASLPAAVEPGEDANFLIELPSWIPAALRMGAHVRGSLIPFLASRAVRVSVITATGEQFVARADRAVVQKMLGVRERSPEL